MSAAIRGAARDLPDTRSRWMSLIWEITECTLTPRPVYREPRSHQTDEPAGPPPIRASILYAPAAHAHLHTAG